jgi:hypothetical protein
VSSQVNGATVDLAAVNGDAAAGSGVEHGAELLAFTEAVMSGDEAAMARSRAALRAVLAPESYVAVAGVIAAFNVVDRIADATGIPLDDMMIAMGGDLREQLALGRFASAANTPS